MGLEETQPKVDPSLEPNDSREKDRPGGRLRRTFMAKTCQHSAYAAKLPWALHGSRAFRGTKKKEEAMYRCLGESNGKRPGPDPGPRLSRLAVRHLEDFSKGAFASAFRQKSPH